MFRANPPQKKIPARDLIYWHPLPICFALTHTTCSAFSMICQPQFEENSNASSVNAAITSPPQPAAHQQHTTFNANPGIDSAPSMSPLPTLHIQQQQHIIQTTPQHQLHLGSFANNASAAAATAVATIPPHRNVASAAASPSMMMPSSSSSSSSSSICSMVTTNVDEPMSFSNPNVSSDEMNQDEPQSSPNPTTTQHHHHHHHQQHHDEHRSSSPPMSSSPLDSAAAVANAAAAFNEAREKMKLEKKERHATKKLVKELAVCKAILEGMEVSDGPLPLLFI